MLTVFLNKALEIFGSATYILDTEDFWLVTAGLGALIAMNLKGTGDNGNTSVSNSEDLGSNPGSLANKERKEESND